MTPNTRLRALQEALSESEDRERFVGQSRALARVQEQLEQVANTPLTVLLLGETGTGKGMAARAVHDQSQRSAGPFISINCGAIPEGLVESELFGHEPGAFTGAVSRKLGKVERAGGGTLFLDEIGDMSLEAQIRLLRLLEERVFERVGGTESLKADVRVVAATNQVLGQRVVEGAFREDLFYRLNVFPVELPPLRQRREDIPLLADYFLVAATDHLHKEVTGFSSSALAVLQRHDWPGNVRELKHAVERAVTVCPGKMIRVEDIALGIGQKEGPTNGERPSLEEYERRYILQVLEETGWVIKGPQGAAAVLGLHPATLNRRIKKLGIVRPSLRNIVARDRK